LFFRFLAATLSSTVDVGANTRFIPPFIIFFTKLSEARRTTKNSEFFKKDNYEEPGVIEEQPQEQLA